MRVDAKPSPIVCSLSSGCWKSSTTFRAAPRRRAPRPRERGRLDEAHARGDRRTPWPSSRRAGMPGRTATASCESTSTTASSVRGSATSTSGAPSATAPSLFCAILSTTPDTGEVTGHFVGGAPLSARHGGARTGPRRSARLPRRNAPLPPRARCAARARSAQARSSTGSLPSRAAPGARGRRARSRCACVLKFGAGARELCLGRADALAQLALRACIEERAPSA